MIKCSRHGIKFGDDEKRNKTKKQPNNKAYMDCFLFWSCAIVQQLGSLVLKEFLQFYF